MNTQSITLDVSKQPQTTPVLHLGQGDMNGTSLAVALFDNGQALALSGYTVRFSMRLPGGEHYYSVNGTAQDNVATFDIDETYAAAVPGTTDIAYVEVLSGTTVIASTGRIRVVVLEGARDGVTPGSAYSDEITEATEAANDAASAANTATEAATEATGRANSAANEAEAFLQGFVVEYSDLSQECKDYIAASASAGVDLATDEDVDYAFDNIVAPAIAGGDSAGRITAEDYEAALNIIFG